LKVSRTKNDFNNTLKVCTDKYEHETKIVKKYKTHFAVTKLLLASAHSSLSNLKIPLNHAL